MNSNHFPQAAAGITQSSSKEITTCSLWRRGQGTSPTLHSRAVVGALLSAAVPSPEVFLPGPFVTIPSSGPAVGSALAAYPRWLVAEFEQEVLYERGLAQVGFGVLPLLSLYFLLSKRLTVCLTWFDLVRATAAHRVLHGLVDHSEGGVSCVPDRPNPNRRFTLGDGPNQTALAHLDDIRITRHE